MLRETFIKKFWNCKVFLCLKLITITQLNFLFVLYFWSSYCRFLKTFLMKWAQFINNYQKFNTRKTSEEAVRLAVFFYVLPRHINIMTGKGFNVFDKSACRCVHLSHQEEECTSSSWGDSKMYTSGSIANSLK